jgi:hypothetical protein
MQEANSNRQQQQLTQQLCQTMHQIKNLSFFAPQN